MSELEIVALGAGAWVEDLGRPGRASQGVPESGALDPAALRLANRLVGNEEGAAGLEIVFGGLRFRTHGALTLAVTGAPVGLRITSASRSPRLAGHGCAVRVPDGALVEVVPPPAGLRSWIAVRGGIDAPRPLGSASTDVLSGLGVDLDEGTRLRIGHEPAQPVPPIDFAGHSTPAADTVTLRAVLGPRDDWFTAEAIDALGGGWTVDARSNRVGVRLDGTGLARVAERREEELPSEGTVAGSVQIAANGLPVLFLADHPVTGGYPVVATVVTADLPLAAQLTPGQQVGFRFVRGPSL